MLHWNLWPKVMMKSHMKSLIFRQLFESKSSTYTYILACNETKKAVIIDPVLDTVVRDAELIKQLDLQLVYGINTHIHADHVTGTGALKGFFPAMKSILIRQGDGKFMADHFVEHGDWLRFGTRAITALSTPGHTDGCTTWVLPSERMAFTGDALLIRGCGRTDFQNGDAQRLYHSVHSQILSLPSDFLLYPAHDYFGRTVTTVDEERKFNPRLTKSEQEFVVIMNNLNLASPNQIDKAVPANVVCGLFDLMNDKTRKAVKKSLERDSLKN